MEEAKAKKGFSVYRMVVCAFFAVIICVLSPLSIPLGAIPFSLGLFAVLLAAVVLDFPDGAISVVVYLLIGLLGLPVFAGGRSGFMVLAGPTGGYLWSYALTALLTGFLASLIRKTQLKRIWQILLTIAACIAGVAVCYLCGTIFYSIYAGITFGQALLVCVVPFIIFDLIKCVLASIAGIHLRMLIRRIARR